MELVGVWLSVENTVDGDVLSVEPGVLSVDVEDGIAECADTDQRVHPLPEEMRGIEVDADCLTADLAQPVERIGVVSEEPRMQLDGDSHAAVPGEGCCFRPVGSGPLVP